MGSKEGIFHLTQAFVENGDAVLVPDPGYVTYRDAAQFAGGEVYYMKLEPHLGYLPDLGALPLELVRRAKLMWLNYPNNPTAAVAPLEFLAESVAFARRNDLLLCHDAAYSQVTFDGYHAPSVLEVPGAKEVAVEFNSLSKSHNMAGWRMGVLVGNAQAVHALFALLTNVDSGHFLPMHVAAAKAMSLDQAWIDQRNKVYQERRNLVVGALQKTGLEVEAPKASLYVWFPVTPGQTSMEFVERALEEAHVSLTSGTLFGPGGEGFVRISITEPLEVLSEAMQRLNAMLDREG